MSHLLAIAWAYTFPRMDRDIPKLKLFRMKRGLSQKELAEKAGLPLWKISQWERSKRIPTLFEVVRVQMVLKGNFWVFNPFGLREINKCNGHPSVEK